MNDPTLTHRHYLESVVYLSVHFWCYTFHGFEQIYNSVYPPLKHHTDWFYCPKNPLCSAYLKLFPAFLTFKHITK